MVYRMPLVVTLRALPDIESEVHSRLIIGVVTVRPEPLDPEEVRVLNRQTNLIKNNCYFQDLHGNFD